MKDFGEKLLNVVSEAREHVVLVAPFIKLGTLNRIMNSIPVTVQQIDCVTRWLPEDVVDGVCDLEIFDQFTNRKNATLWKREDLHAKFIRGDGRCLLGSANLTGRGLGWNFPFNFELMLEVDFENPGLVEWEAELFSGSLRVTPEIREELAEQVRTLELERIPRRPVEVEQDADPDQTWMPLCPSPEMLFGVYLGSVGQGDMVTSAYEFAINDLRTLGPPNGFSSKKEFTSFVASRLRGLEVFQKIFTQSHSGLSDDDAIEIIIRYLDPTLGIYPEDAWNSIKLWLMYFFKDEFRIAPDQEVLILGKTLKRT